MPTIAFVTYRALPQLAADDRLVVAALAARGVAVDAVAWDEPEARWSDYDAVVVRSTWDYHRRAAEFGDWLERLECEGARVWNPAEVLRWNMDKRYLRDLAERGIPVAPTAWVARGESASLRELLDERGWADAVVKPTVSASATGTWRVRAHEAAGAQPAFEALLAGSGALVQRYLPEVGREGEWSLVFIGGTFSHAVLKRPRAGDFRVQVELGGSATPARAPAWLIERAAAVVAAAPRPTLYARVDGVVSDGRFLLMELEMLEPSLFLDLDVNAPGRFAEAIASGLGTRHSALVRSAAECSRPPAAGTRPSPESRLS